MPALTVTVVGAGIVGLWQAYELARRGHAVTLIEAASEGRPANASRLAGAMLAPWCESEVAEPIVRDLGIGGIALWRQAWPGVVANGTLVVAAARDQGELVRFARLTGAHHWVDTPRLAELEPDLAGRFARGLYYADEAHLAPREAMAFLVGELRRFGGAIRFETSAAGSLPAPRSGEWLVDCRGIAARDGQPALRGVRGEMAVLHAPEVALSRPVRLLHPRFPLYVVPWGNGRYMVGATVIERDDAGPVTPRSALDLLGTAYTVHPSFGEAEILELSAGVRPAYPSNVPRIAVDGRTISVNGVYRHGFLLAPVLARLVAEHLETGATHPAMFASA